MPTYHIRTDVPAFTQALQDAFAKAGWTETTTLPADFVFFGGGGVVGRYADLPSAKGSKWVSLLYGDAKTLLTDKANLTFSEYSPRTYSLLFSDAVPILRSLYILKPVDGFQGKGIRVVQSRAEVQKWTQEHPEYRKWVLQKYLQNPDTFQGFKFHLRVVVCVMVEQGKRYVYVCKRNRYVLAKEPYINGDWTNFDIHDTHAKSNPRIAFFPEELPDGWTTKAAETAQERIEDCIQSLWTHVANLSLRPDLQGKNGFELFGADILFEKKHPYILEFNKKMGLFPSQAFVASSLPALILQKKEGTLWTRVL
jgi:hypothetical protein